MTTSRSRSSNKGPSAVAKVAIGFSIPLLVAAIVVLVLFPDQVRALWPDSKLADALEHLPVGADVHDGRGHYLDAVAPRDDGVRELAVEITRRCRAQDRGCEASRLLRHVATKIKYVSDPRGDGDYVQPPMRTVELGAGDCEDQTILLASLFESIGIRTLLAFTDNHVHAMACTEGKIARRHLGRGAKVYAIDDGALYCYPAEPTNTKAKLGQEIDHDGFLLVADPVDGSVHEFARAPE